MENSSKYQRNVSILKNDWYFLNMTNANDISIKSIINNGCEFDGENCAWQKVCVPHDWAITGDFCRFNDLQITKITQDGEEKAHEHNGRTGGLPHVGSAIYCRVITFSANDLDQKTVFFDFDGVMSCCEIYFNGKKIGKNLYGYTSFRVDATSAAKEGDNLLVVVVENLPEASRWYPGAGIYRKVTLNIVEQVHFSQWGIFAFCDREQVSAGQATVNLQLECQNFSQKAIDCMLKVNLTTPDNVKLGTVAILENIKINNDQEVASFLTNFNIQNPQLWGIDNPQQYIIEVVLIDVNANKIIDKQKVLFGVRSINFSNENGFELNNKCVEVRGVCMHHDLGPLGAAVNYRAIERQIELLQSMGCNAIRTSHNPPAVELLDICDKKGVLVIDEAFDEWRKKKVKNGYHTIFEENAEYDLTSLIRRDRNHPCVIAWSIGNEIQDQDIAEGAATAKYLADIVKKLDKTRPITIGFDHPDDAIKNKLIDEVDLVGWNYKQHRYHEFHNLNKNWICYGSETMSTVSSRGIYHFPVKEQTMWHESYSDDLQLSSYDLIAPPWACLMESEFHYQSVSPFIFGQFVWTGFDYIGEPTPFGEQWPARSSYFGIFDLVGLPKDRFYMFKSLWCEGEDVLHILPHWTWYGRVGMKTPVHVYANCHEVELFLNDRSLGRKNKDCTLSNLLYHYRFIWEDVLYEHGELIAKGYDKNNNLILEQKIQTAGHPNNIKLTSDRLKLAADGEDMAFITVEITDRNGILCPHANNLLVVEVTGAGQLVAFDAGNSCSLEPFNTPQVNAFSGKAMVFVKTLADISGEISVVVKNDDLISEEIIINSSK
ncbi:glycoside hydrolase family 2 TIM barrel-domain containing protein [Lentisphaerota bacterium WC36G]|nr:DUF4982 domain-containing protein [Lentisphaerae bacterium WC36]